MDPNNNQPLGTNPNPVGQPAVPPMQPMEASVPASPQIPVAPPPPAPTPPPPPALTNTPDISLAPKAKSSKTIILLVILLLLVIGMIVYILFAKNQMDNTQKAAIDNTSTILPSPTPIPTKSPEADLEVESPEADLIELDADVKGL